MQKYAEMIRMRLTRLVGGYHLWTATRTMVTTTTTTNQRGVAIVTDWLISRSVQDGIIVLGPHWDCQSRLYPQITEFMY